jgi:N-acetylneuraminic acid mutarotase
LRDFYEYDPDLDRWKPIVDYPGKLDVSFRGSPQVVDGKAYIAFTYQDFYSYNPALQQWKRLPAPPGGSISSTGASFVIGRDIYYVGGYNSMGINTTEVWSFNTLDGSWTRKSNFPGNPRRYGTGYSVDGKGYLCLGLNGSEVYNDHWMYDPDNDTWIRLGDFPGQARAVALCMMISDMAYIGTGYLGPGNLIGDMYRFNAYSLK